MLSVDRPSTECRPINDRLIGQVSTNYRPTIGEVSAKCRRSVGEVSVNEKLYRPRHIWNDYRPCLDRVSTDYRPLCRPTVDRVSTEYRPSVDRVSTAISTDISVDITHSKQDPWTKHISLLTGECYMDMLWFIFLSQVIFLFLLLLGMVIIIMPMF